MSNFKDLVKEREEKKAEINKIRNAERQERFMQAKRILPNKVLEYVKNNMNKDLDRESVFVDFEELVEFVNPQVPRAIIFWKTQNAWSKDEAEDAVRNVLREVAETIASHGLSVEYISGYNLRVRWDKLK